MIAETTLASLIRDEIGIEPTLDGARIDVSASAGVVTLTGDVSSDAQKHAAEQAARRVAGVIAVANDIDVHAPDGAVHDDTMIARMAVNALKWSMGDTNGLTVTTDQGWVTLDGLVDWNYQRQTAEAAIRELPRVRGVTNQIKLRTHVTPTQIRTLIEDAYVRSAQRSAQDVEIRVSGGDVTLAGQARSPAERIDAERATWSVPCVTSVQNKLEVVIPEVSRAPRPVSSSA